ncbi:transcriptional regulator GcvA [Marivita geojedonensis]|uniref:Transcriptional regulator n=1 Tax=Marivita geojedonensis TaxID=1123756 RepID=A0A1X4NL69_9RHOB|nr:transcriptional regulator GcvA [Marivita geojedonensis]OSQ51026.1 transcriptional regulator [Marivita geojedonensis]PRY79973.1 LysR family transcriptional regulator [Marivita geojedonensis]
MNDRLPPLTALRAFEAAARHMSFAQAAAELNVTPAALSFQIKSLEEHLGAPVFRRLNRAVELTEEGEALRAGVHDGFDLITTAWRSARRQTQSNTLTVTAGPAFTAKVLAPRLFQFAQAHPDIDLRFSASLRIMDFVRDDIDVAIRFGYGGDEGLYSRALIREWIAPMMTPALAKDLDTPEKLLAAPLIFDDSVDFLSPKADWAKWFKANGLGTPLIKGSHFSQADHAVDAALAGGGVVLARSTVAAHHLIDGQLVAPFDLALSTEAHFRFVCPKGHETKSQVAAFSDWLDQEIGALTRRLPQKTLLPVSEI